MITDLATSGAIPALEATLRFAGQRHRVIANNIANLSTPDYRQVDVSPAEFQRTLREAVQQRRKSRGGANGTLDLRASRQIRTAPGGGMVLQPREIPAGVLFHDRNNRDLERTMQGMVENMGVYRVAADLLRSRYAVLQSAISERV